MRKWLVEETGEIRPPQMGEHFLERDGGLDFARSDFQSERRIIRITEIDESIQTYPFDEWNW